MTDDNIDDLVSAHREVRYEAPAHRVAQWHAAIDEAAALERGKNAAVRGENHRQLWVWGAVATAALVIGIAIGVSFAPPQTPHIVDVGREQAPDTFSRGLQYHLRDSRARLASLTNGGNDADASMLVLDIVAQNRLFEAAAENRDAHDVARVLRAFEPILLRLAADDIAPADADALREQLSFELTVMLTKYAQESSDQSETT